MRYNCENWDCWKTKLKSKFDLIAQEKSKYWSSVFGLVNRRRGLWWKKNFTVCYDPRYRRQSSKYCENSFGKVTSAIKSYRHLSDHSHPENQSSAREAANNSLIYPQLNLCSYTTTGITEVKGHQIQTFKISCALKGTCFNLSLVV